MVFSGIPFIFFFLVISLILYYIVPFKAKNYVLLAVSLIFYAWGEPVYVFLMIFSTLVSWLSGVMLLRFPERKKLFMIISVVINLSILGFFKYAGMFISTSNSLFDLSLPGVSLALPIGISFYTFQTMSYNIDIFTGNVKPEKHFFTLMTYITMFPQLIAGPIVRYENVQAEMKQRSITFDGFCDGTVRFLYGLFKKVLLANPIGELFSQITASSPDSMSLMTLWMGVFAFYLQIYFDFSGYSDMAIGMGKMLGFNFLENFNYPFSATSVSDFWRRWHMSLTTWFKDYVYIPLGGSRCSKVKHIRNLLIVWALTGLWHGASWNFVVWGLYFGIFLILEKFVLKNILTHTPKIIKHLYTTVIVTLGWAIFSLEDFSYMSDYIRHMFINKSIVDESFLYYAIPYLPMMLVALIFALPIYPALKNKIHQSSSAIKICVSVTSVFIFLILTVLSIAMLVGESYNPFLYFRF